MIKSYSEVRRETEARNRSLRDKVVSLEDAAALVVDGDHALEFRKSRVEFRSGGSTDHRIAGDADERLDLPVARCRDFFRHA